MFETAETEVWSRVDLNFSPYFAIHRKIAREFGGVFAVIKAALLERESSPDIRQLSFLTGSPFSH